MDNGWKMIQMTLKGRWVKKMWQRHTMKYYSLAKKKTFPYSYSSDEL